MTAKERVLKAVNHEPTDKIPVDLGGSVQSTIHAYVYAKLRAALGIESGPVEISDTFILAAKVEDAVRDALQIDTVPIYCPLDGLGVSNDAPAWEWTMPNGLKVKVSEDFSPVKQNNGSYLMEKGGFTFKLPRDGYYFDPIKYALQDARTLDDVDRMFDFSDYRVMMHNCGSIYAFIPDLIDCGIDILNPVQFTACDMDLKRLKSEFGKDITFWGGGVDTQKVLPFGSEKEVREQVRQNARILSPGGGFVFHPVHCIQAHVPVENILAAFDEINRL